MRSPFNFFLLFPLLLPLLISGCALLSPTSQPPAQAVKTAAARQLGAEAGLPSATAVSAANAGEAKQAGPSPAEAGALTLANYGERVRNLGAPELNAELTRLGSSNAPQEQLQLALALAQLNQIPELIRAQDTVAKVLGNGSEEAKALHPLARLLMVRLSEQRRLEDLLDKQTQQARDLQRRLDQTTERLEALKAIERSLVSRPTPVAPSSAPSSAPGAGNRLRAPAPRASVPQP